MSENSENPNNFLSWECPVCGSIQYDPLRISETTCKNGHNVELFASVNDTHFSVREHSEIPNIRNHE